MIFAKIVVGLIYLYRWLLSPAMHLICGPGCGCRFTPTCSQYALHNFRTQPFGLALVRSLKRIGRCHPWGASGSDPVVNS